MATQADNEAMTEIANWARTGTAKTFPPQLHRYFETHDFRVTPPLRADEFPVHPYEVIFSDKIVVQALPGGTEIPDQGEPHRFFAYVVKMIPRDNHGEAIKIFKQGEFVSVDVARPAARVVVTTQLQGCSFVIGYDKEIKEVLHLGHAQPSTGGDVSHSAELAEHFKNAHLNSVFEGKQLKKVKVIGGFGGTTIAKLLGWVSAGKLFVAVKTPHEFVVHEF